VVIRVADPDSCWEAFQATLVLKRAHKRLNRTVIQALVRERLELCIEQMGENWRDPARVTQGCAEVEEWMKRELSRNGLELESLELVEIPRSQTPPARPDLLPRYDEFWIENVPTVDGFELNLSLVVRSWVPAILAGAGQITWPQDSFKQHAWEFFSRLDSETCLAQVQTWQASLSPLLAHIGDGVRSAWALMTAPMHGMLREDSGITTDVTWVTRRQLRSGNDAFVPGQRYKYLDAYHLFFLLRNWQQMPDRYRMGKG
jgi:hypothetical protein